MHDVNGAPAARRPARRVRALALGGLAALLLALLAGALWLRSSRAPSILIRPALARPATAAPALDAAWRDQTLALLAKTRRWDGLPTGDLGRAAQGDPESYATYYALRAYRALGAAPPNAAATVRRLQASQGPDGHLACESAGQTADGTAVAGDRVGCIFYTVETLALLGAQLPAAAPVIAQLQALQSPAGAFAHNEAELAQLAARAPALETDLLATWQAVTALQTLGAAPARSAPLTSWLAAQWARDELFDQDPAHLTLIVGVADTLRALHTSVATLPDAARRRSWAESLQPAVLSGPSLDLYVVRGWLALLADLGHADPPGLLRASGAPARLAAAQEPNGGFTAATGTPGDFQGVALALELLAQAGQPIPQPEKIRALLDRHALADGGALGVLQGGTVSPGLVNKSLEVGALLGGPPEDPAALRGFAAAYLAAIQSEAEQQGATKIALDDLYQTALLVDQAGVDRAALAPLITVQATAFAASLAGSAAPNAEQLLNGYLLSQLVEFDGRTAAALGTSIGRARQADGSYATTHNSSLRATWLALHTLAALKVALPAEQTAATAALDRAAARGGRRLPRGRRPRAEPAGDLFCRR